MGIAPNNKSIKPSLNAIEPFLTSSEIKEIAAMKTKAHEIWERHKDEVVASPATLKVQTMAELFKESDAPTAWLWQGIIERGDVTMIPADAKAGKSTFLGPMVVAMLRVRTFLGYQMNPSKILFASEEAPRAVGRRLSKLGVTSEDPNILRVKELSLPKDANKLFNSCREFSADVVIIDTMATFFEVENENDNAAMSQVLKPLSEFAHDHKISLVIAHHSAASGKAIRGATSIFAAVDQAIRFRKPKTGRGGSLTEQEKRLGFTDLKRQRGLFITGRHYGEGPNSMIVQLTGKPQLSLLRDSYDYELVREFWNEQDDHVYAKLRCDEGMTIEQMMDATGYRKETVIDIFHELIRSGQVNGTGKGVRADPHKYWKVKEEYKQADSVQNRPL